MASTKRHSSLNLLFKVFVLAFVICPVFFSCKKKVDTKTIDLGYNYFPTTIGKYVVYDVDSIVFDKGFPTDTFKFQIKEINESEYSDNAGRPTIRIERYKKKYSKTQAYSLMNWTLQDVWNSNRTNTTAEKVEENIKYVKMVFPMEKSKSWKGNAYNSVGDWDYKYTDLDKKRTIGTLTFDSTAFITQYSKYDLLNTDYYVEIYAKNIGMVYKEITTRHYDSINAPPTGLLYKMVVNSVGP